jgi:hypothetical protein
MESPQSGAGFVAIVNAGSNRNLMINCLSDWGPYFQELSSAALRAQLSNSIFAAIS